MTSCDNLTLKVGENIEFDDWSGISFASPLARNNLEWL